MHQLQIDNCFLDSEEVDMITANIIHERNPVCYGADRRWANHLYPIYVTESYVKSKYLGEIFHELDIQESHLLAEILLVEVVPF